ncbi:tyrosine-type recombinase/integrase [Alkalihalobacillus deserti]|uniref:tyrosine-type recombinase/integrase n=1 Tax=Alkalihalobacillus deserti TaxID=2879466 RepID=UPI001D146CF4|nr:tyrosine-type recombinase/integrase [Alkalihalobacillus deserti]
MFNERKTVKKGRRTGRIKKDTPRITRTNFTLTEMFERFFIFKSSEGLSPRTLEDYETHFNYFIDFIEVDIPNEDITTDIFLEYRNFMLKSLKLKPSTVNIRVRTMRAFIRYSYEQGYIEEAIHERFKPIKAPKKEINVLTPAEIKLVFNQIDDSMYAGFRDKAMLFTLLDTMVRSSELLSMKRTNVNLKEGIIKLEADQTKTRTDRIVPISTRTVKLLKEYIEETDDFENELLFLTYDGEQIQSNTLRKLLAVYGESAGIKKSVSRGRTSHPWDSIPLAKLFAPYLYEHVSGWLGQ